MDGTLLGPVVAEDVGDPVGHGTKDCAAAHAEEPGQDEQGRALHLEADDAGLAQVVDQTVRSGLPEAARDGTFLTDVEGADAAHDAHVVAIAEPFARLDQRHIDLGIGEGRMLEGQVPVGRAVASDRGDGHDQVAGVDFGSKRAACPDANDRLAADRGELVGGDLQARSADSARYRPDRYALVHAASRAILTVESQLLALVPAGHHLLDAARIARHQHRRRDLAGGEMQVILCSRLVRRRVGVAVARVGRKLVGAAGVHRSSYPSPAVDHWSLQTLSLLRTAVAP